MNALIEAAVGHARTIISILVLVLIAGTFAFIGIPKEAEPDINIPIIYVSLSHEGISPEDAERLLIRPMEEELRGIEAVKEMRATAYEGGANVVLEFDAGFDADQALLDVREKVDIAKPELPEDADEPTVNEVNFSLFPVLVVTLSGAVPERTLLALSRNLRDRIEGIASVLSVEIAGDREEQVEIIIDPLIAESYGLDAAELISFIDRSNRLVAAGSMDTGDGRFAVKVPGLLETVHDIMDLPMKVNGDAVVRLQDIAQIRRTFKDPSGFARINGQPAIALEVSKRSGENIIDTIDQVREVVEEARRFWPEDVIVSYSQDKSTGIKTMLQDLQNNVISAVLLVMIVVVAALGLRSAGLVGIAIPGSFLTAILVLAAAGLTVNIVVLFSLILAVGMLVDGAIVVTEYADRKMTEGLSKRESYTLAAKRMAWPITASTATTLAAFLPLMFWPGIVGEFMKFLPITLLATLAASLAMALIFVPTLGSIFGKAGGTADPETMKHLAAGDGGDMTAIRGFTGRYLRSLDWALRRPGRVLAMAFAVLIAAQVAYGMLGRGVEFFPEVEPDNVGVLVHARGNLSVDERDMLLREVEERVFDLQRERGEFHAIYGRSILGSGRQDDQAEDIIGNIQLELTDWHLRRSATEILDDIRDRSADLAGIRVETRKQESGPQQGKPIEIEVSAEDPALIEPTVTRIVDAMDRAGGFVDIEDGRPLPGIEWEVEVNRAQAAKFGADVATVGNHVRLVTNGMRITEYRPDDSEEEVDIVVRYPARYRHLDQLDHIRIETDAGQVPISNFVTRTAKPLVGLLRRVEGRRALTVRSEVADGVLVDDKVREMKDWFATAEIDPRVTVAFKGEDEEQAAAQDFLSKAFLVALFLMAIILVTQFNSFYSAFLILSAVIMSTIGVMIGLLVTGQPFGIVMSGIGVIALAGIVVNNNIVLIDTFDRISETETDTRLAILRTGAQRLRPVLLTTVTTVLGLMPMVLRTNIDFVSRVVQVGAPSTQWWSQLATAIVFGLTFATVLTLVVTPCALMLRANVRARFRAMRERMERRRGAVAAEEPGLSLAHAAEDTPKAAE